MARSFDAYLALGDSISIDLYPVLDVERRYPGQASTDRLGAVSLFYRNDDRFWPAFRGRDLHSIQPALRFDPDHDDLTADGATTHNLLRQVERIERNDEPTLVTITAGGNDLLGEIGSAGADPAGEILQRLQTSIGRLFELRPNATVLLGTVYDPSDGTNRLPGYGRTLDREAEWLRRYNDEVRRFVTTDSRLLLADIHAEFVGHGMTVPERDRWYLQESIIEPSAGGASEVRRVWLEALGL